MAPVRAFALLLLLATAFACDNGAETAADAPAPSGRGANYCVAHVEAVAEGAVDSARLEEGQQPVHPDPREAPAFKRFVAAAPDDIKDEIALLTDDLVGKPDEQLRAASEIVAKRMKDDCLVGAETPLSDDCRERAVEIERQLAGTEAPARSTLESFGEDCRPEPDPYESMDDLCVAFVYGHYIKPTVEGIVNVGFPTGDDTEVISGRFVDLCLSD